MKFHNYTISGTIYYYGEAEGPVFVQLIDYFVRKLKGIQSFQEPGSYTFLAPNGTYYVASFMDVDMDVDFDNETKDEPEPAGLAINKNYYAGDSPDEIIVNGAELNNIDIILYEFPT